MKPGTGKLYIKTNGETMYWCSSKCEKNAGMGRDPKKVKWSSK